MGKWGGRSYLTLYCRIVSLVVLWSILFLLIYKVLTLETTHEEYDPFAILQVDSVSRCG